MPSKNSLVLLSALAITIFVSLPRLAIWQRIGWPDLSARAAYLFLISILFFYLNLPKRRLLISIALFIVIDFLLIRLHIFFFKPAAAPRIFQFLFNINMSIAFTMTILLAEIFRLLFRNAETRYEVLKNQMNPHFLFNSLNTVNALIMSDREAAVEYVNNMSDVFRYVLKSRDVDMTTVEEELRFIRVYIDMLKGRHGDKLEVNIDVDAARLYHKLPPLALQVLVENAVKHNVVSHNKPLRIRISSKGGHQLTVSNNLQKRRSTGNSTGLGLTNLNQRCKYLSNRDLIIQPTNTEFIVTIPLMAV